MRIVREAGKERPGRRGASRAPGRSWCSRSWRVVVCADAAAPRPETERARRLLASLIVGRLDTQANDARKLAPSGLDLPPYSSTGPGRGAGAAVAPGLGDGEFTRQGPPSPSPGATAADAPATASATPTLQGGK